MIVYTGDGPQVFAPFLVVIGGPLLVVLAGRPLIGDGQVLRVLSGSLFFASLALSGSWYWRRGRCLNAYGTQHTVYFIPFQYFAFAYWAGMLAVAAGFVQAMLGR